MKARILALTVDDEGTQASVIHGATSILTVNAEEEMLDAADQFWGDQIQAHGFIDVEIPDDVIAQVLRRHADAGVVAAEAVSEVRS
jgi:hypothetical protein